MSDYLGQHGTKTTPQSERMPGRPEQVLNTAGGFVWETDKWQRLTRFLILGSEGGSYYASERTLTTENVQCIRECIAEDGPRTVAHIATVSHAGRAPKRQPVLYALASCISLGDKDTRRLAAEALPGIARTGADLFTFTSYAETMRGWGRTMRWAVGNWYDKAPEQLAYQVIKYRSRKAGMPSTDPWTHRDLLRLSHPHPGDPAKVAHSTDRFAIFDWICHPSHEGMEKGALITAFEAVQHPECTPLQAAALVREFNLPREALQTEHLTDPEVWRALIDTDMPMHALVRNLPTMTRLDVLDGLEYRRKVIDQLGSASAIAKSRLHPMTLLIALHGYAKGYGLSRERAWKPMHQIIDALDEAFFLAFSNVEPSNLRTVLSIDVSGSMSNGQVAGSPLSPRQAAAAMAMVMLHTEPQLEIVGISDAVYAVNISKRQRLDDVTRYLAQFPASRTDLSLPFKHANPTFDGPQVFVLLTDNETWSGGIHPAQALDSYRKRSGIAARSIGVAMVANKWSIGDPQDPLSLDCVGFDTATPTIMADFAAGRI